MPNVWTIQKVRPVRRGRVTELRVERVDAVGEPATGRRWAITKMADAAPARRTQLIADVQKMLRDELTPAELGRLKKAVGGRRAPGRNTPLARAIDGRSHQDTFSALAAARAEAPNDAGVIVETSRGEMRVGGDTLAKDDGRPSFANITHAPTLHPDGTRRA